LGHLYFEYRVKEGSPTDCCQTYATCDTIYAGANPWVIYGPDPNAVQD